MIGLHCKDSERMVAQEFFELFKTPWQFFSPEEVYDVVISTRSELPQTNARLVILFSSQPTTFDHVAEVTSYTINPGFIQDYSHGDTLLPIYCGLSVFKDIGTPLMQLYPGRETSAFEIRHKNQKYIRAGYDLFSEIIFLLQTEGQPVENAMIPSVDLHISLLRGWIVNSGIALIEIPPIPWGYKLMVCLSHDIDFAGIRKHKGDHTMWGFIYRSLVISFLSYLEGKIAITKLVANWKAVFKLPFIFAGLIDDFWEHFDKYADIEKEIRSTFFLIPFKNRCGDNLNNKYRYRRATKYDIDDVEKQVKHLLSLGFEIGLHGIDAWNSTEKGSKELERIIVATGQKNTGVRMHWLCYDQDSPSKLEEGGFAYDATLGYNETVGFRNGTVQVFKPIGVNRLLEIPLNVQDTTLFYPRRLNLSILDAKRLCNRLLDTFCSYGGVLTLSWHDRSLESERLWGDYYRWLLMEVRKRGAWIGKASEIVEWFSYRRSISLEACHREDNKFEINLEVKKYSSELPIFIRLHIPSSSTTPFAINHNETVIDKLWQGESYLNLFIGESEKK